MCSLTRTRAIAHDGNAGCSGCDGRVVGSQTHRGIGTIASLHTIDALRADDAGAAWPSARAVLLSRTRPEDRRIDHGNGESRVPAQVCFRPGRPDSTPEFFLHPAGPTQCSSAVGSQSQNANAEAISMRSTSISKSLYSHLSSPPGSEAASGDRKAEEWR